MSSDQSRLVEPAGPSNRWRLAARRVHLGLLVLFILCAQFVASSTLASGDDSEVVVDQADSSLVLRAEELLANGQVDAALDLLVPLLQLSDMRPLLVRRFDETTSAGECRLYWPLGEVLQARFAAWGQEHPEWLARYRRRTDPLAQRYFEQLATQSLVEQAEGLARFRLNTGAAVHIDRVASRQWELGNSLEARRAWLTLCPDGWDASPLKSRRHRPAAEAVADEPPGTGRDLAENPWIRIPLLPPETAAGVSQEQVLAKLAVASLAGQQLTRAEDELNLLRRLAPATTIRLQGQEREAVPWLEKELQRRRDVERAQVAATQGLNQVRQSDRLALVWEADINPPVLPWANRLLDTIPTWRSYVEGLPRIAPAWSTDSVMWSEGDRVRILDRLTGLPRFPTETAWDSDSSLRGTVWEAANPTLPRPDERSAVGRSLMTAELTEDWALARTGDPRTIQRDELPRTRSQLVGLELAREGSLLAGFPLSPGDPGWEFEGAPVSDGDQIYVLKRSSQRDAQRSRLVLACFALRSVVTGRPWTPRWETPVAEADSLSLGQYHELSQAQIVRHSDGLYVVSNLGGVGCFDRHTGRIRWLFSYPRHLGLIEDQHQQQLPLHLLRSGPLAHVAGQQLIVLPGDTPELFCLDAITGTLQWRCPVPTAMHCVGVTDHWIILSGLGLVWVDRQTGEVACRWPSDRWPSLTSLRWPTGVGAGRAFFDGQHVYWATDEELLVVSPDLVPKTAGGQQQWWQPTVLQRHGLAEIGVTGGDLFVEYPRVWVVGAESIVGLEFTSTP